LLGGLIFVGGLIRIPLGPLPFTFQTMFVLLSGLLLTPSAAAYATLLHLMLKIIFAGASAVLSPSFGFVLAFIPAAALLAYLTRVRGSSALQKAINLMLVSFLIYLIGLPYMVLVLGYVSGQTLTFHSIVFSGMLIFLPGDALKIVLALIVEGRLRPAMAG
jgi:biotin transport system substrate-specific component